MSTFVDHPSGRTRGRAALPVLVGCVVALLAAIVPAGAAGAAGPTVTGGGASFPSLLINQWRSDVAKPPYNLNINYSAAGSGFGRDKYISGALDFGQSDIPFLDEELPRVKSSGRGSFVYVPVAAGALAFTYNVAGHERSPARQHPADRATRVDCSPSRASAGTTRPSRRRTPGCRCPRDRCAPWCAPTGRAPATC